jgi:hypothetical protein
LIEGEDWIKPAELAIRPALLNRAGAGKFPLTILDEAMIASHFREMAYNIRNLFLVAMTALLSAMAPAQAQYDRDGRYVPSPNGIPADPYAKPPVSGYPGTPGGARNAPLELPRGGIPSGATPVPRLTEPKLQPYAPLPPRRNVVRCDAPWSKVTGLTPTEFRRHCKIEKKR